MPVTLLTDIAEAKITLAAGSGSAVAVTHIALGDGGGANYDPNFDQATLVNERARIPIERRTQIDDRTWRVKGEFPPETAAFDVREMGFFDADNALIAVWAGADVDARRTGVISYLVDHVLIFSRVAEGAVIVDAPDDDLFDHVIIDLEMQATLADQLFEQRLMIRDLQQTS